MIPKVGFVRADFGQNSEKAEITQVIQDNVFHKPSS